MTHGLLVSLRTSPPTGEGQSKLLRKRLIDLPSEFLPGVLKARKLGSIDRYWIAEVHDAAAVDRGQREPRVRSPDVGCRNLSHRRFSPRSLRAGVLVLS